METTTKATRSFSIRLHDGQRMTIAADSWAEAMARVARDYPGARVATMRVSPIAAKCDAYHDTEKPCH